MWLNPYEVDTFRGWLVSEGWVLDPNCDEYQVLRAKKSTITKDRKIKKNFIAVYRNTKNTYLRVHDTEGGNLRKFSARDEYAIPSEDAVADTVACQDSDLSAVPF